MNKQANVKVLNGTQEVHSGEKGNGMTGCMRCTLLRSRAMSLRRDG